MAGLTLIKLGGSVLTDKKGREALRSEVLARLCSELASKLPASCVVGHGSGSFGHRAAVEHGCLDGAFSDSQAEAAAATREAALRLHGLVFDALLEAGINAVSRPPADWCRWRKGLLETEPQAVLDALNSGAVPLVMGDVVAGAEGGARIASTEVVFVALAAHLSVERAIWVGDTDGILAPDGSTLTSLHADEEPALDAPQGADVTGGMGGRWRAVQELARRGSQSVLLNGARPGQLQAALAGEPVRGTQVLPNAGS